MIPDYNDNGYLPFGPPHCCKFEEFKKRFVDDFPDSISRSIIFNEYKKHCKEIITTNIASKQWVNGSYITTKEEPEDIDMLTEIDGIEMDDKKLKKDMDKLFYDAPLRTNNKCDSYYVAKYPEECPDLYEDYIEAKTKYLTMVWGSDREYNLKGLIELDIDDISGGI
jgi:hypothetical protein